LNRTFDLTNPIVGNRIQIRADLGTSDTTETPIVTDITWKYILLRPASEDTTKRVFHFTVIGHDEIEKLDFDKEELGLQDARSRATLLSDLWTTRDKEEILNFVGADNVNYTAFVVTYTGAGTNCYLKIDQTNRLLTTVLDGVADVSYDFKDKTIKEVVTYIHGLTDYTAVQDDNCSDTQSAHNLFPVFEVPCSGSAQVYYGTDIRQVIFNTQAPSEFKLSLDGRGDDRINISLREV